MPAPFLSTLSRNARAAYPIVRGGVQEGLSANSIGRLLQERGLGFRRTELLSLIREIRGVEQSAARLATLRRDARPDPTRLPEAITKLRNRYSFDIRVQGVSLQTGEPLTRFVTVTSSQVLSRGELEGIAQELVEEEPTTYGLEIEEVQLLGGRRAGAAGVL